MNKKEDEGRRHVQIGKLKQKFATLIENDLLFVNGKKEEILGELQIKHGKRKEELQQDSPNL
jgi:uncharacterized protein YjbJ (UPF0337 family)